MITASQLKSIKKARLPTWVIFGSRRPYRQGLLCPHKRTSSVRLVRSEKCCQKRKSRQAQSNVRFSADGRPGDGLLLRARKERHGRVHHPFFRVHAAIAASQAFTFLTIFQTALSRPRTLLENLSRELASAAQQRPFGVCTMIADVPGRLPPCHRLGPVTNQPLA